MIPLAIVFFFLRRYFLETSRDVKRLESTSEYRGEDRQWVRQCDAALVCAAVKEMQKFADSVFQKVSLCYHKVIKHSPGVTVSHCEWSCGLPGAALQTTLRNDRHMCGTGLRWISHRQRPSLSCSWHMSLHTQGGHSVSIFLIKHLIVYWTNLEKKKKSGDFPFPKGLEMTKRKE